METVTATGTVGAAIYAAKAANAARESVAESNHQAQTILWRSLDQEFNSESRREQRRSSAIRWRGMSQDKRFDGARDREFENKVIHVLDFLETVARLVNKKQIDEELAKHTFWNVMSGYFHASKQFIEESKKEDPTFFEDLRRLMDRWGIDEDAKDSSAFFERENNS